MRGLGLRGAVFGLGDLLAHLGLERRRNLAVPIGGFFRAGSLVFGGGHVVLPMLRAEVATLGHLSAETFLAVAGGAALPGPLFAFAGYLGTAMSAGPGGVLGGALAIVAIFLPGFLLLLAALPFGPPFAPTPPSRER